MTEKEKKEPTYLEKLRGALIEPDDEGDLTLKGGDITFYEGRLPEDLLEWWARCRAQTTGHEFTQVSGGDENLASGIYSAIPGGRGARMDQYGAIAMGNELFNGQYGHSQWMTILLSGITEGAETVALTLDGVRGGYEMEIYQQSMWMYDIDVLFNCYNTLHGGYFRGGYGYLRRTTGNAAGAFVNPSFIAGWGTPSPGVSVAVTYSTVYLRVNATGFAGLNHHWVARVNIVACGRGL
jgi:hypothetical protein